MKKYLIITTAVTGSVYRFNLMDGEFKLGTEMMSRLAMNGTDFTVTFE